MAYTITELMIDVRNIAKPQPKTRKHCGKGKTCHGCTRCTSTAFSRHKPSNTYNTCGSVSAVVLRKQLLQQLRKIARARGRGR